MKSHIHRRPANRNGRLLFALLAWMLLITLSSFGYAQWSNSVTTTAYLASGTEDIRITNYDVVYYNGYGIDITIAPNQKSIAIEDTQLFPEWELKLAIEIHNPEQVGNLPLYISSEIQYNGETINETQLLDLFRIIYTDGFYLDPDLTEPVTDLTEWQLWPGESWYKLEHLIFDAQDYPELQDQSFTFQVIIYGTFTGGGP